MMNFLKATKDDIPVMSCNDTNSIKWHVNAAFAIHKDMKSHTGATMTLGAGTITSISTKQKVNTCSSTESELVAHDDVVSKILWSPHKNCVPMKTRMMRSTTSNRLDALRHLVSSLPTCLEGYWWNSCDICAFLEHGGVNGIDEKLVQQCWSIIVNPNTTKSLMTMTLISESPYM
jgi:hypothetical protein